MRRSIKIILLIVAVVVAIWGVAYFYKTIVSPPQKISFKNQYDLAIRREINSIKGSAPSQRLNAIYDEITHEIAFDYDNSLITATNRDKLIDEFAAKYAPLYARDCFHKFQQSIWNETELHSMSNRIKELQDLTLIANNSKVLQKGEVKDSLDKVSDVLKNYNNAKRLAYSTTFSSIEDSKEKIKAAKRYAETKPLSNCVALQNALGEVSSNLERSHYAYLERLVNQLANYRNYSQRQYDNMYNTTIKKINEYENNAYSTYGQNRRSVDGLRRTADEYCKEALKYF